MFIIRLLLSFCPQRLSGNTDSTSVAFNDVNTTRPYRYVRFHPVDFNGEPCMQAAVFGCNEGKD